MGKPKQYGVCFALFDTPQAAAREAVQLMTPQEMAATEMMIFETDNAIPFKGYLDLMGEGNVEHSNAATLTQTLPPKGNPHPIPLPEAAEYSNWEVMREWIVPLAVAVMGAALLSAVLSLCLLEMMK